MSASIASFYLVTKNVLTHVRVVDARVGVKLWQKSCKKEKRKTFYSPSKCRDTLRGAFKNYVEMTKKVGGTGNVNGMQIFP